MSEESKNEETKSGELDEKNNLEENVNENISENEKELTTLTQNNDKMEKYIQLLAKQYELELQYIEQYCDFKSKVEKLGEKYAHINISTITPLQESFNEQLNYKLPTSKPISIISPNNDVNEQNIHVTSPKRRNTIATVAENNPVKDDIRNSGNLQDHLKDALNKRFQSVMN